MAEIIKAEVEAACKLLEKNGFYGVLAEASSNGVAMVGKGSNIAININSVIGNNISNSGVNSSETINRLLSIIEAQNRQIAQLVELLTREPQKAVKVIAEALVEVCQFLIVDSVAFQAMASLSEWKRQSLIKLR